MGVEIEAAFSKVNLKIAQCHSVIFIELFQLRNFSTEQILVLLYF